MVDKNRLIYADKLLRDAEDYGPILNEMADFYDIKWLVDAQTTVDAAPVVHGKWVVEKVDATSTIFKCSKCYREVERMNDYFLKPTKFISHYYPYCHCGAKMDLEV